MQYRTRTTTSLIIHYLPLAIAEVTFWFICRRKRLVARADGCGERCRMTFLATWRRLTLERTASSAITAAAFFRGAFRHFVEGTFIPFPESTA